MDLSGSCPNCDQAILRPSSTSDQRSGETICPACSSPIWFTDFGSELVIATATQLETHFGFDPVEISENEAIELLRAWHQDSAEEPWHVWDAADDPVVEHPQPWDDNPYHPPHSEPRKTDWTSQTFKFRACVYCDDATLQWATKRYSFQSDVAGLAFFGCLVASMFAVFLLVDVIEFVMSFIPWGWLGWIIAAALFWMAMRWGPSFVMAPYVRILDRRCDADPLFDGDHFWITVRKSTLTASSESTVVTWPLRMVRSLHDDVGLMVLRVAPQRLLFVTSTAETIPEDFRLFRKGMKKRLRRYLLRQSFRLEIN